MVQRLIIWPGKQTWLGVYIPGNGLYDACKLCYNYCSTYVNSHKNSLELVSVCAGKGAVVVDEHEDTNEKNRCCTLYF